MSRRTHNCGQMRIDDMGDKVSLAGGSIRIHQPQIQAKVFEFLNISKKQADDRCPRSG